MTSSTCAIARWTIRSASSRRESRSARSRDSTMSCTFQAWAADRPLPVSVSSSVCSVASQLGQARSSRGYGSRQFAQRRSCPVVLEWARPPASTQQKTKSCVPMRTRSPLRSATGSRMTRAVDPHAVAAAHVFDARAGLVDDDARVPARDERVLEGQVAVEAPPDDRAALGQIELLQHETSIGSAPTSLSPSPRRSLAIETGGARRDTR